MFGLIILKESMYLLVMQHLLKMLDIEEWCHTLIETSLNQTHNNIILWLNQKLDQRGATILLVLLLNSILLILDVHNLQNSTGLHVLQIILHTVNH